MSDGKEVISVNLPNIYINHDITVKFQIIDKQTVAQIYPNRSTVEEVKEDIAKKFKILPKYLSIKQGGISVPIGLKLYEIWRNSFGIIEFELCLNDLAHRFNETVKNSYDKLSLNIDTYYGNFQLPEFFSVQIPSDENGEAAAKRIIVEIVNKPIVKPFIGGYRDKRTGVEYHDAFSQTGPPCEGKKWDTIVTRDTQTVRRLKHKCDDTNYDSCTQCFGDAVELLYQTDINDYVIEPKKYETYDEMCKRINKIGKVKLIQRNFRRYMWQKFIKEAAAEWRRLCTEQERREHLFEERVLNRFKKDCTVKTFPKTKEDFDMLYAQVQFWKDGQIKIINEMYSDGPRIAELNNLLDKEIQLLNGIERQKSRVKKRLEQIRTQKHLEAIGAPVKWIGYRNIVCEMDLLRTQRVRKFTEYYKKLIVPDIERSDRIKLINEIDELIKNEKKHKIIEELQALFAREKIILSCDKIKDESLEILRQRETVLFMDIIKDKEVKTAEIKKETRLCIKCEKVRQISEFALHTKQVEVNICIYCTKLQEPPIDVTIYRAILRSIRRDERKRNALSSYAFIVQEKDIRDLVENIWHGHSILSQCDERKKLRLPRFNIGEDWSPWNCICLTESEAKAHIKIIELDKLYEDHLLKDIRNKHQLAKLTFKKLKDIDFDFVESGEWWNVGLNPTAI